MTTGTKKTPSRPLKTGDRAICDKYLDEEYLKSRIMQNKSFRSSGFSFVILHSDRPASKTLYVRFTNFGKWVSTLRVSDHLLPAQNENNWRARNFSAQFVCGEKKKDSAFEASLNKALRIARERSFDNSYKYMEKVLTKEK